MSFSFHRLKASPSHEAPAIGVLDRGFQLGDGVFDTLTSFGGKAFMLGEHLRRLQRHGGEIGIAVDTGEIEETVLSVVAEAGTQHAIIRTTVTRGQAARGLWPSQAARPTILVSAQPWAPTLLGQPVNLRTASIPRNQLSPLSRIKSLAYLDNILAAREAAQAGCDDALILNLAGDAVCSTIANVFAVEENTLFTPPCSDGCLNGIIRGLVIQEAGDLGLACVEASLTPAVLAKADALFLTNSVRLVRPVARLDGRVYSRSAIVEQVLARLVSRIEAEAAIVIGPVPSPVP